MAEERARIAAKGWLTRAGKKLESLIEEAEAAGGFQSEWKTEAITALDDFKIKLNAFDDAQYKVEAVIDEEKLYDDIDKAAVFRDSFSKVRAKIEVLLSDAEGHQNTSADIKLPKLNLPLFYGEFEHWPAFWESFEACVGKAPMPECQKFAYLRSLLRGEASKCIEGLSLTAGHFKSACDLLKSRYGRPEKLRFMHVEQMLKLQVGQCDDLRKLQDTLLVHIRSLESLDVKGHQYGIFLTPLVLSKLPESVRMEWARGSEGKEDDLDHLLGFLNEEVKRQERSGTFAARSSTAAVASSSRHPSASAENRPPPRRSKRLQSSRPLPSAAALTSTEVTGCRGCSFCQQQHPSDRCPAWRNMTPSDRYQELKVRGLCFCCLSPSHGARYCKVRCQQCGGRHHQLCCLRSHTVSSDVQHVGSQQGQLSEGPKVMGGTAPGGGSGDQGGSRMGSKPRPDMSLSCNTEGFCSILPTATVNVMSASGPVKATLIFDSGSDRTYVSEQLMRKVEGKWKGSCEMMYATFGGGKSSRACNVYEFDVCGANLTEPNVHTIQAVQVPIICAPLVRPRVKSNLIHPFKQVELADTALLSDSPQGPQQIDILVGQDRYWSLMGTGLIRSSEGLVAQETAFGWVLSGMAEGVPGDMGGRPTLLTMSDMTLCPPSVGDMWSLEGFGVCDDTESDVLTEFNNSVRYKSGRYVVELPWKKDRSGDQLMDNRAAAESRLAGLSRKLSRDPELQVGYDAALQEMEHDGVISEVTSEQMISEQRTYYLPHRPVVKVGSVSTKVRPVFDASARGPNGLSLNDCVEVGPMLMPNLQEVLIRFRRWRFGLSADIVKAFHQIRLADRDLDVHRFLWCRQGQTRVMRFQRVVMGVASSPFLMNATVKHHLSKYADSPVICELRDNLYVDDWLTGADSPEQVTEMLQEASSVMAGAGMELAKCCSNSTDLFEKAQQASAGDQTQAGKVKVLGVTWSRDDDTFSFAGGQLPEGVVPTKRLVLSVLARLFDPLGFVTPFVMMAKCMFQELWSLKLGWDDDVPDSSAELLTQWMRDCQKLQMVKVPRCYSDLPGMDWSSGEGVELHAFADASPKGYGAAVYMRVRQASATSVSLVMSKGRVAPLKRLTLPRLELLGCLMAARLVQFVRRALRLPASTQYTCWTDSMIALGWIRGNPQRWKQFVANRVTEIQELTSADHWSHCRSEENPADMVTRGVLAETLLTSSLWFRGPDWLSQQEEVLGRRGEEQESPLSLPPEETAGCDVGALVAADAGAEVEGAETFLDLKRYGTLSKATRVVGWMMRFVHNVRRRHGRREGELSSDELAAARDQLFRLEQTDSFAGEIRALREGKAVPSNSPIHRLGPFLSEDDGLLRIRGRLQFSELSYEEKHPIILPKGHLATLLVREQHLFLKHAGVSTLITAVRSAFWVVGLRSIARRVVRRCVSCRKHDSRACCEPAAPLPQDRTSQAPPFSVTGVDFAGPLFCVDSPKKKLYVCLFTCAVSRAVHLEITESLSLSDFMMAFRRFTARRGVPSVVYSDNARTFKGADAYLQKHFGHLAPRWKFMVPRAPWWGGMYERLVRSVKAALKKSLGQRSLSKTELETVLVEVEACVNSRPLTFVGDAADCPNPLTPNHFLVGHSVGFRARELEDPSAVTGRMLSDRAKLREKRLDKFWSVWMKEYIRNLPPAVRKFRPQGRLCEGAVVLIGEENVPRLKWDLGVVTRLLPGRDGIARSAEVRTAKGRKTRAVQRLHDLEVLDP